MVHNKGGCKVGRREHGTKGGCKVGKRNPTKAEKEVAKSAAKKGKKLLKAPTKRLNEAKGVMKSKAEKKARIQQKVRDLGKAQIAKKKEKKKDFTAKPKPKPKKEKIIYPTKVHNIRGEQYAVHKGKIYKYDKYSGERGGQINIAGADIKDKSVIDTIKNLSNPKAPAKKAPAKAKAEPTKVLSSVKLGGKGMDLPDLYKHGMGNASKVELGNMLDKMGKDINAEIKKMKTADRAYFKVVKVRGGTEYHTEAANIMNQEQQEVQKALERYVKTHGIRDPGVQEMIGKFNRQAKSAVNRMRKAKGAALERLGFI